VHTHRRMASLITALALATSVAAVSASPAAAAPLSEPSAAGAIAPAAQEFYWEWSDGVDAKVRTFRESKYQLAENLPVLYVFAEPARPQQFVKLQYKQGSTWKREDGALTNRAGRATLELNPICENGTWCGGTYKYRLLVNGIYTIFTITYVD
jgi:hypothetical protein